MNILTLDSPLRTVYITHMYTFGNICVRVWACMLEHNAIWVCIFQQTYFTHVYNRIIIQAHYAF